MATGSTSKARLALFASGDFAFNLYWQSVMLYLLFYYTEAVHIPIGIASACYAAASVWDGIASLAVGLLVDRYARPSFYRLALMTGSFPLGLSFIFAYAPPLMDGYGAIVWVMAGHLLFRTLYAMVNIPYLAMSARISADSGDRTLVAGGRMLAGTIAAIIVAVLTLPLGSWMTGSSGPRAYAGSAALFAAAASLLLFFVGLYYRDGESPPLTGGVAFRQSMVEVWRNRAFLTLSGAMMAMIVAVTLLDKSILYYFKYRLGDQGAGQLALGWMMAIGGIAIPLWLIVAKRVSLRAIWFIAVIIAVATLLAFVAIDLDTVILVQLFFIAMQVAIVGLNFAIWALLPDVVDYGQHRSGTASAAVLYGFTALLQRIAIGLGTGLLGLSLGHNTMGNNNTMRLTVAVIPLLLFLLSAVIMLFNPLHRSASAAAKLRRSR